MQVNIKISDKLYSKLKDLAKKERRTITGQLEIILSKALEEDDDIYDISHRKDII